jgi:hypothetical protein
VRLQRSATRLARTAVLLGISVPAMQAMSATAPTAADLARCAGIVAPDARLACYDALAGRSADRSAPTAATTPAPASAPTAATTPAPASAAPPTAAPAPATLPQASTNDPRNFGFTEAQLHAQAQPHAAPEAPATLQARIAKFIDNRAGRAYVVLDNGQTWALVDADDDARLSSGDAVTIKRASLGSFLMVTPSKHSLHVRRLQ